MLRTDSQPMKGKNKFTTSQINQIKELIAEKVQATPEKQKAIRGKIRMLGFHYSDFNSKKDGYTVIDFENLVHLGLIKIIGENSKPNSFTTPKRKLAIEIKPSIPLETTYINSILCSLKMNSFDPMKDNESVIADCPGNYILCLRYNAKLPNVSIKPTLSLFEGLYVIYTGIASVSLRIKDYRQHFKGHNAGRSTLRES